MLSESYKNRLIKLAGILNEGVSEDLSISILKKQNSLDKLSELKSTEFSIFFLIFDFQLFSIHN